MTIIIQRKAGQKYCDKTDIRQLGKAGRLHRQRTQTLQTKYQVKEDKVEKAIKQSVFNTKLKAKQQSILQAVECEKYAQRPQQRLSKTALYRKAENYVHATQKRKLSSKELIH